MSADLGDIATGEDPIVTALCGRVMELVRENETLRSLVVDMAANVPTEKMDQDELTMLADTLNRWRTAR